MSLREIYLLPSIKKGNGTGHLRRCARQASFLEKGILSLPEAGLPGYFTREEVEAFTRGLIEPGRVTYALPEGRDGIVLLDRRETDPHLWGVLPPGWPVIGLDEGGPLRTRMDYLLDTLPGPGRLVSAHRTGTGLLGTPRKKRSWPERLDKILVVFGGEDSAGLTERFLEDWAGAGDPAALPELWVCTNSAGIQGQPPSGVNLLPPTNQLSEELHRFDLVITSFGLTAFESLAAQVPVLLRNPSRYHHRLSRQAGLPLLEKGSEKLKRRLENFSGIVEVCRTAASEEGQQPPLDQVLRDLILPEPRCPGCGSLSRRRGRPYHPVLARFPRRTFRRCGSCGLVYQLLHQEEEKEYTTEYFFEEYSRQYGRTYLEDFPQLRAMAAARLKILGTLISPGSSLVDLGCAYGAFLLEAREAGYRPAGVDVAPSAVAYITEELGLKARVFSLDQWETPGDLGWDRPDAVTLWYVIEHLTDLKKFLHVLSLYQKPGDVLAFSTPHLRCISARRRPTGFRAQRPRSHHHIWSPRIARTLLALYGYRIRRTRITGHHPERFPGASSLSPLSVRFRLLRWWSRLAGWGDTFEVYAVKRREGIL